MLPASKTDAIAKGQAIPEDKWTFYECEGCEETCRHECMGRPKDKVCQGVRCCAHRWDFANARWKTDEYVVVNTRFNTLIILMIHPVGKKA